jgi:hypothetical protein
MHHFQMPVILHFVAHRGFLRRLNLPCSVSLLFFQHPNRFFFIFTK